MKHLARSTPKKSSTARQASTAHSAAPSGFNGAGHIDAGRAKRLRAAGNGGKKSVEQRAFLAGTHTNDVLAEELAESVVACMTSGQDELRKVLDDETIEERGGPFVDSAATGPRTDRVKGKP